MIGNRGLIVEIGATEAKGVLFTSFLGNPRIERTESVPFVNNEVSHSIDRLLSLFPSDADITLLLPGYLFMVRSVSLPFTDRNKIRKTLPYEMEGMLPVPVDSLLFDSVHSTPTEKGGLVMAMAIPDKTIADYMGLFPSNRKPARIIPDFLSLISLCNKVKEEDKTYGIISFSRTAISIVIISDDLPVSMRSVSIGNDTNHLQEWLTSTIKHNGHMIKKLYVTGIPPSTLKDMVELTPLPVVMNGISPGKEMEWRAVAGGALTASEFPWFNILGLSSERELIGRLFKSISIGTAILLAIGTGDLYLRYRAASHTLSAFRAESKRVFMSALPEVRKIVKEDAQLKDAISKERELRENLIGKPSPSYLAVLKGIETIGKHLELKVREIQSEGYSLMISGDGNGITADGVKKIFSGIEGTKEAMVEEMSQGASPDTYRFRVRVDILKM